MEKKRKVGRPRKIEAEPMTKQIRFRTTETIGNSWEKKAEKAGFKNLSEWFRSLADAA